MTSGRANRHICVFILRTAVDLETIDDLARLALQARRAGRRLAVLAAPAELLRLIERAGLADVVGVDPKLRSEVRREAEPLEQ